MPKPKKGIRVRELRRLSSIREMPKGNFAEWLVSAMKRRSMPVEKQRVKEYVHLYNRTRQLIPQMVDFVETIFERRKKGKLHNQLVFLGRGARPFYRIAFRLAPGKGISTDSIKLIEAGRRLTGRVYENPKIRSQILGYLKSKGIDLNKPISFIDTGVIGTVPNDLIQMFKLEGLSTKVNGYLFYGRNIHSKDVKQYAPSPYLKWKLSSLSEREARAIIEQLPKSTTTIKQLISRRKKVKPKYVREEPEEIVGSLIVRRAIVDALKEISKTTK